MSKLKELYNAFYRINLIHCNIGFKTILWIELFTIYYKSIYARNEKYRDVICNRSLFMIYNIKSLFILDLIFLRIKIKKHE